MNGFISFKKTVASVNRLNQVFGLLLLSLSIHVLDLLATKMLHIFKKRLKVLRASTKIPLLAIFPLLIFCMKMLV